MSVFRSVARPDYPGNRKEGEVAKEHPPRGFDEKVKKVDTAWGGLVHGPECHEDQHSMGKGRSDCVDEAHHTMDHDPGWNSWGPPHGSKEQSKVGLKHKM